MKNILGITFFLLAISTKAQSDFGLTNCVWNKAEFDKFLTVLNSGNGASKFLPALDSAKTDYTSVLPTYRDSTNELVSIELVEKKGNNKISYLIIFLNSKSARIRVTDHSTCRESTFYSDKKKRRFKKLVKTINQTITC